MPRHPLSRALRALLGSPAFLVGGLAGLLVLLASSFWPVAGGETMRDVFDEGERDVATLAFLFLKAPASMIAGGLALDFLSRRVFGKGGAK